MKIRSLQVGPICTNCYLLEDEDTGLAAVIDPGDEAERISALVEKEGVEVRLILLTHGHFDHTTGVGPLRKLLGPVPVYIHKADAGGAGSRAFPLSGQVDDLRFYQDGDELSLGGLTVRVMETPGHSAGSVTLQVGDVLFCGDTLFAGSCGRTDLPGGSWEDMERSLRRLGRLEGDFRVLPGHGEGSTLQRERRANPYLSEAMKGQD